ncbi:prepilin-type N-terminal cleavage/methylation domain-containing protein [Polynucleobacter victoriensis]|uniref:prepilin-type N-terminal cleavage/methylation domain-containing protein n=1 Tax=Polynucleobacter victoriensis TaxID=2049319 RepID=UPI000B59186D|nr:prepilin-type N-terminal cleavage/methylation domain-containing protein [Polynucleobacter victoriensis]
MSSHTNTDGFTLIEVLIAISLLGGSYFVISSTQQFVSSYSLKLEHDFFELIELSNEHELSIALLEWGDE